MNTQNKYLGILGGGQLGLMLCETANDIGIKTKVWSPPGDNIARRATNSMIEAAWDDKNALEEFVKDTAAVTLEFENVPVALLHTLKERGLAVHPSPEILAIAQDRWEEKSFFDRTGIPATKTRPVDRTNAYASKGNAFIFPGILKTRRNGYDGKGQKLVHDSYELEQTWLSWDQPPCVLEAVVDLAYELSIIVASDVFGSIATWPAIENEHRDGILRTSMCPGPHVASEVEREAVRMATTIARALKSVGLLTVEMFVARIKNARGEEELVLLANELAPRPHNSGHGTIEACNISQFEQLVRIALGQPLIAPRLERPWRMTNLIGENVNRAIPAVEQDPTAYLKDYGKSEVRPDRKMGHITRLL